MLDLTKLAGQMQGISQHLTQEATASRQRLERAIHYLQKAQTQQQEIIERQQLWHHAIGFSAASPVEPLETQIPITPPPAIHAVLATDGSQIAPSHHEIAYCYLVNVGRVVLYYGQNRHPILDNLPEVFYRPEDLYVSRQWGIRTEEWMSYQRTVSEVMTLAELGSLLQTHQADHSVIPTLAMLDGSLIYWFLESLPNEARDRILPPILEAWQQLQTLNIPLVGYLSAARSGESLNFLRLLACPHREPNCVVYCHSQTDSAPCQIFQPLRDTMVWAAFLEPGYRGCLWRSSARILDQYSTQRIYFCYVNVGTEIARIEFPEWVAQNPFLLDSALSLTLAQVQKGCGYPVALAEAHNQAVVRGGDRARFFAFLEQEMIKAGLRNVGTSYKEARKRGSIA